MKIVLVILGFLLLCGLFLRVNVEKVTVIPPFESMMIESTRYSIGLR